MSAKLFVGNLSFQATEEDLRELFAQAGNVETVRIITDQFTGRPRGFGFVENFGSMQKRLGRYAAPIQAHAAGIDVWIDERYLHPEIGGVECGRVPARTRTNNNNLSGLRHDAYNDKTNGCSNASAIHLRNRAPSAPSMTRWS